MKEPARADTGRERVLLWLLAGLSLLTRAAFIHRGGMPDPDSVMVAAGVALGATGDVPFSETFLYGRALNPGVYLFMRAVQPLWNDPGSILALLNWTAVVCGALTVLPLYDLCRMHLSARVALACTGIWAFTPLVWDAQTSFHPIIPATLFLLLALMCARRTERARTGGWYFLAACVLASAAVLTRSDVMIAWPAVAAFALAVNRKRRAVFTLIVCSVVAVLVYAAVLRATAGAMGTGRSMRHFWDRWSEMYRMGFSLAGLPRSLAWAGMGLGVTTLTGCAAGLLRFARSPRPNRRYLPLLVGLLLAVPSIIFWGPYMVPILRHYYLASIGFVWLAGFLIMQGMSKRRLIIASLVGIACNLFVPEALYRGYNATQPVTKTPHGAFFYSHEFASRDVERLASLRESVLTCARSTDGKARSFVVCRWDGYANVMYGVASSATSVSRLEERGLFSEVVLSHYASERADVQLVRYLYMEDAGLRDTVSNLMMTAWKDGYCIFIPQSVRPFETLRQLPGVHYYP